MRAAPRITPPAMRQRMVRRRSGGQSAMASLAAENADAQSRQNVATSRGSGMGTAGADGAAIDAGRMGWTPGCPHQLGAVVVIWKLNDTIICSGISNGGK